MRRRRLLALLAGSAGTLSGCAGVGGLGGGSSDEDLEDLTPAPVPDPTERPATETEDGDGSRVHLSPTADFEAANRRLALPTRTIPLPHETTLEVGFDRPFANPNVIVLRGRLSNDSLATQTVDLSVAAPFAGDLVAEHAETADRATVTLVPTPNDDLVGDGMPTGGVDAGACRASVTTLATAYPDEVRLDGGEVISMEFRVCPGASGSDFPTGRYTFGPLAGDPSRGTGELHFVAWDPDRPGPTEASALDDPTPPSLPEREVAWFHEADPTSTVWYRPSEERVTPPATVEFVLSNRSAEPIPVSGHRPWLFKLVDGSWHPVKYRGGSAWGLEPWDDSDPLTPGTTESRSLCLAHGSQSACEAGVPGVGHLGGGRYAAVADLGEGHASKAALVDVDAPPVAVEPNEGVTVRERTDRTVHLGLESDGETDGEATVEDGITFDGDRGSTVVVVERVDAGERRLLPEQVMQPGYATLRDTLPFFDPGVDRVELRAEANPLRYAHPVGERSRRFVFDGDAFEVRIDR